jgi:phosphotransferase system enzyme I (PtsP)
LRALKSVVDAGKAHGKPVALCGELASRPLEALALAAIGYRTLSVSAAAIGPVKAMVLGLDVGAAAKTLVPMLTEKVSAQSIRERLKAFATESGVPL